jgi:acetyl-CoA carboxylase carboxyl transferase subunit alpha
VISPEGCASILLRDAAKAKDAAAMMRITSSDLLEFKVINGIIPEPPGGAHRDPEEAARIIKEILVRELQDLCGRNPSVLIRYRNQKIRKIGHWHEGA